MAMNKLEKSQWKTYFDRVSKSLEGTYAEIEVAGLNLGDQIEADRLPLMGLSYDPKDDVFLVVTKIVDHLIRSPKEIYVDYGPDGLHSVEVTDADDNKQVIELKSPLMLPGE